MPSDAEARQLFANYPANTFTDDRGETAKRALTTDGFMYPSNYADADDMPGVEMVKTGQTVTQSLIPITDLGKTDRRKVRFSGAEGVGPVGAAVAGTAVIDVFNIAVPPGQAWYVERVIVETGDVGAGPFLVRLYETANVTRLDDMDILANFAGARAEGDYSNPIMVQEGSHLLAQFLGLTAASGSRCTGIVQYHIEQT